MKAQISSPETQNRIILYTTADGKVTANVFFAKETFWLTQRTMAELFGITIPSISRHLKNIYESQELSLEATVSKIETVQKAVRLIDYMHLENRKSHINTECGHHPCLIHAKKNTCILYLLKLEE